MTNREHRISTRFSVEGTEDAERKLDTMGRRGQEALDRLSKSANPASASLAALDSIAGTLENEARRLATPLGVVGDILARMGPVGVAGAAGVGAVAAGLLGSIRAAEDYQRQMSRLEGVLKATGGTAGLTADQIDDFAERMAKSTLATDDAVRESAAVLATFQSVSGQTFTRTIELAQDMAAVFGGDLRGSVQTLGRALEDPIRGMDTLRRSGIVLTEAQRGQITLLTESGERFKAQGIILDALAAKVGGAGAAEAQGLTGKTHQLANSWNNLLENIGKSGPWNVALSGLTRVVDMMDRLQEKANKRQPGVAAVDVDRLVANELSPNFGRNAILRQTTQFGWERRAGEVFGGMTMGLPPGWTPSSAPMAPPASPVDQDALMERAKARGYAGFAGGADVYSTNVKPFLDARSEAAERLARTTPLQGFGAGAPDMTKYAQTVRDQAAALDELLAGMDREVELLGLTDVEREKRVKTMEAEKIVSRSLTDEERARVSVAVEASDAIKKRQAAEKAAAEETKRIWTRAAEGIQDSLTGTFRNALEGNLQSSRDFWASFKNFALDTLAQVASAMVFRPVVGNLINSISGGAISGAAGGGAAGGFNPLSLLSGASSLSGLFGGPSLGGLASSALGGIGSFLGIGAAAAPVATASTLTAAAASAAGTLGGGAAAGAAGASSGLLGLGALGGPLIAGGVILGGLALGKLFGGKKKVARGSSLIDGRSGRFQVTASGATGGGDTYAAEAKAVADQVNQILDVFGGVATGGPGTSVPGASLGADESGLFTITSSGKFNHPDLDSAAKKIIEDLLATGSKFPDGQDVAGAARTNTLDQLLDRQTGVNSGSTLGQTLGNALATAQGQARLGERLNAAVSDLRFSPLSPLSPADQYGQARTLFDSTLKAARSGDVGAVERFPDVVRTLLDSSRKFNASSGAYADDFSRATGALSELGANLDPAIEANSLLGQIRTELGAGGATAQRLEDMILGIERLRADAQASTDTLIKALVEGLAKVQADLRGYADSPAFRSV